MDHHELPIHQEREWLSCSASPSTRIQIQDAVHEDDDDNDDNNNNYDRVQGRGGGLIIEKEHMFDKVVTPSDVGKLNRLVIPKQHAEKYFPLDSSTSCNTENKAGLLLNFEDRSGKSWRFRYSYWNSSQSYVMTKGWSRFVKEKQLCAGDILSFERGVGDELARQTFFINWRRRPPQLHNHHHHLGTAFSVHHSVLSVAAWSSTPAFLLRSHPYSSTHLAPYGYGSSSNRAVNYPTFSGTPTGSLIFLRPSINNPCYTPSHHSISSLALASGGGYHEGGSEPKVYESAPPVRVSPPPPTGAVSGSSGGGGAAKRSLRLFGVNMDFSPSDNDQVSPMEIPSPSSTSNFELDPK